jgi:hypothetical protein
MQLEYLCLFQFLLLLLLPFLFSFLSFALQNFFLLLRILWRMALHLRAALGGVMGDSEIDGCFIP